MRDPDTTNVNDLVSLIKILEQYEAKGANDSDEFKMLLSAIETMLQSTSSSELQQLTRSEVTVASPTSNSPTSQSPRSTPTFMNTSQSPTFINAEQSPRSTSVENITSTTNGVNSFMTLEHFIKPDGRTGVRKSFTCEFNGCGK